MGKSIQNQYMPDSISPPGETMLDTLEALGMTQADLAERTGRSTKMINEIIKGKAPITPKMAIELERVLDVPATFWNNRERQYRETIARLEEHARLQEQVEWLGDFPINAMAKWGWIKKCKEKVPQVQEVLRFFGIASPERWPDVMERLGSQVAFRKSEVFEVDNHALIAWLRKGEIDAKEMPCEKYNEKRFQDTLYHSAFIRRTPESIPAQNHAIV